MRVGIGYDVHRLVADRPLIIGGVEIPFGLGLLGHSDADVLIHAIMDALLGAARLGDIGRHFPDDDVRWEGASSLDLLEAVAGIVSASGWRIVDIDSVVIAQAPKLSPYRDRMRSAIAESLGVNVESVGVKATTTEGLGFEGRGEGMAAHAIALLDAGHEPA